MTAPFRAFVVDQTADGFQMGIQWMEQRDLPPGDVLIKVAYAALNYKDALVCIPKGGVASTGKPDAQDYLRQLGASEILSREETSAESTRPLESERWAGSIDTVGGATLAYLMRTTKKGGAIAAIGVSGGAAFHATVYPLILRGINVLGIDMPSTPLEMRRELWEEVMRETTLLSLSDVIVSEVTLGDIPRVTQAMLGGQTRGRILVRPSEQ